MEPDTFCTLIENKMKAGLYTLLVLHVIGSADHPIHGYMIIKSIDEMSNGKIVIRAGTVYPILKQLERQGLLNHTKVRSTQGPPRKCYRLTRNGEVAFHELNHRTDGFLRAVEMVRDADQSVPGRTR